MKKLLFIILTFTLCGLSFMPTCFGQQPEDIEFTLDVDSKTTSLPKIFRPTIDLSGRGYHNDPAWPQTAASSNVLDTWREDIGFSGIYRLQYNLWEITQLAKEKEVQKKLLANYESIIKSINDSGGIVILNIFGTPAGLAKILDKKAPPQNLRAYKALIKKHIKELSYNKRYNIWYEVWSAPDLDDFFLGRQQEYLNLYRIIAECVKEIELETKVHIPIGGPSVSWWFQNFEGNSIVTPERSLIYELIKFCYRYQLPIDFITWHCYSSDPFVEQGVTTYGKTAVSLIRDWLSYFRFDRSVPLIVDEWNYDLGANVLQERQEKSFMCASYIPARIKNMYEAGIDYQIYFSLEDFHNNKEGVVRNTGAFWFDAEYSTYKGGPKAIYNIFRMLDRLGDNMYLSTLKLKDDFVGVIATKGKDYIALLIYNYVDPQIAMSYLSKAITKLNGSERRLLLNIVNSDKLPKILLGQIDIATLRLSHRTKAALKRSKELNDLANKFISSPRNIKINITNLKDEYLYQRYTIDNSCSKDCNFAPAEEKEINPSNSHQESLSISSYSTHLLILKKKPKKISEDTTSSSPAGTVNSQ